MNPPCPDSRWKPASHLDFIFKYLQNDMLVAEPDTCKPLTLKFATRMTKRAGMAEMINQPSVVNKSIYLYKVRPGSWKKTF
jgi:hypothetical protein